MNRILACTLLCWTVVASARTEGPLYQARVDLENKASLQRGARLFTNYCLSCHSAAYSRYSRVARDLGLTEDEVANNLMFTTDKIGNTMTVAMRRTDAESWFGTPPPDLSVIARARGADWLYTFLLTFYEDPSRPTGVNNLAFKDTAMPHVLWELQGYQKPVVVTEKDPEGRDVQRIEKLEPSTPGLLDARQYRDAVRDLVNFLVYMGEPAKMMRQKMGAWVILFLVVFWLVARQLKKEYWKDVR
ncbi:MAG TPA: cytochrome c1 [Gammaproteobacteria bacterium]|nr:cytochrome c1 [Gammaproteobacteria bacterium]